MSRCFVSFGGSLVSLDYDLDRCMDGWHALRGTMARLKAEEFTRDEWAYLLAFVDRENLIFPFQQSFKASDGGIKTSMFRPRGAISIWLPNNVSLLGPLVLIMCCLTGAKIRVKVGSRSNDLCQAFINYAQSHLPSGELRNYLSDKVSIERFNRDDGRNLTMASEANVRIVFGSDAAAQAIEKLPHPVNSIGINFVDHRSEAWVQMAALTDERIIALIKVFAIYGQAGCTSPRRIVVIDGTKADCNALRRKMFELWPSQDLPMHIVSQNILNRQLAAAEGWDVQTSPRNAAVMGVGAVNDRELTGLMSLAIVPATAEVAASSLPSNIQTVGHCLLDAKNPDWISIIADSAIKRWVPIGQMHHFGHVWDGMNFWRQLFEEIEFQP